MGHSSPSFFCHVWLGARVRGTVFRACVWSAVLGSGIRGSVISSCIRGACVRASIWSTILRTGVWSSVISTRIWSSAVCTTLWCKLCPLCSFVWLCPCFWCTRDASIWSTVQCSPWIFAIWSTVFGRGHCCQCTSTYDQEVCFARGVAAACCYCCQCEKRFQQNDLG